MKFVLSLAAVLALAIGITLPLGDEAEAGCWRAARCGQVAVVPAPVVVQPVPVSPPEVVYAVPQPNPIPVRRARRCGGNCYTSYRYPLYAGGYTANASVGCGIGVRSCGYFRQDCWYDAFGRRFCN